MAELHHMPACISYKHPILIIPFPILHFAFLNSFCAETQRSWASLSPGTRWVILVKRPWFKSQPEVNIFKQRRSPCHPIQIFQLWAMKLVHSARTRGTFFCISLHLDSQYLSLCVYKSRHCKPWMPPLRVLIKFKPTVPTGLKWTKKERRNMA